MTKQVLSAIARTGSDLNLGFLTRGRRVQAIKLGRSLSFRAVLTLSLLLMSTWAAIAQPIPQKNTPDPSSQGNQPQADAVPGSPNPPGAAKEEKKTDPSPTLTVKKVEPEEAGLNDEITLSISNLSDPTKIDKLILFLDGKPIKGSRPELVGSVDPKNTNLKFKLIRDDTNADVWNQFLVKPRRHLRETEVKIGYEDQGPAGEGKKFNLRLYNERRLELAFVGFLVALVVFLGLAWKTNIIRDSGPPEILAPAKRPYSLARTQIAWWFFIIFGSFLLIRIVTDDYNTINTTALVLLGIGTGTALGAVVVDNSKRDSTRSELLTLRPKQATLQVSIAELRTQVANLETKKNANSPTITAQELETLSAARRDLAGKEAELEQVDKQVADVASALNKPESESFLTDIFSDINGVSFHRFQMVAWTITLGIIFIRAVYKELAMPEFNDTILTLMGISAGTYIGFKIPERQTDPETQQGVAGGAAATGAAEESNTKNAEGKGEGGAGGTK